MLVSPFVVLPTPAYSGGFATRFGFLQGKRRIPWLGPKVAQRDAHLGRNINPQGSLAQARSD
jgi:hypothetical protein